MCFHCSTIYTVGFQFLGVTCSTKNRATMMQKNWSAGCLYRLVSLQSAIPGSRFLQRRLFTHTQLQSQPWHFPSFSAGLFAASFAAVTLIDLSSPCCFSSFTSAHDRGVGKWGPVKVGEAVCVGRGPAEKSPFSPFPVDATNHIYPHRSIVPVQYLISRNHEHR